MICVLWAGQSLAYYMTHATDACCGAPDPDTHMWTGSGWSPPTGNGLITYLKLLRQLIGQPVYAIVYAPGGTSLLPLDDGGAGHWLGSIDAMCITAVQAALATVPGLQLTRIEWWGMQQDCFALGYADMYSACLEGLASLLTNFRAGLGNAFRFCVWPVGRLPSGQSQQVVRAQMVFSTTTAGVEPGPSSHDLLTIDGVHLQPQANAEMGRRGAENACSSLCSASELHGGAGPRIIQLMRTGTNLYVDVALKDGATLLPAASTTNWAVFDAVTFERLPLISAAVIGRTIMLTLSSTVPAVRIGHAAAQNYLGLDVYDSNGQVLLPLTPDMMASA